MKYIFRESRGRRCVGARILMMVVSILLVATAMQAQTVSRNYRQQSLPDVLMDLDRASSRYHITFIYNDLEDYTVTKRIREATIPDAVREVVGYYPMSVVVGDSIILVECTVKEDTKMIGRLIDESGRPLPFANVSLLSPRDSMLLTGGVSNENGDFVIPTRARRVLLKVSFVGYQTLWRLCDVGEIGTLRMTPAEYTIRGVTISGSRVTNFVDKSTYTFTLEQIANARDVRDLLTHVETLHIDPVTNKLARLDGGSVKILLNGASASDLDLRNIPPEKIIRVEYYNIPPARFADAGALVKVYTKRLDTGVSGSFDARTAFTTGFADAEGALNFTSGNHQLALSYWFSLREYDDRHYTHDYAYRVSGQDMHYHLKGNDQFGYRMNEPNIKYTYSRENDITVQVKANPAYNTYHSHGREDIDATGMPAKGESGQSSRSFGPSLNAYLSKVLPHQQELTFDLVGTYYHNRDRKSEWQTATGNAPLFTPIRRVGSSSDAVPFLADTIRQRGNKYSLIGEVAYTKAWGQRSLSLGYRGSFGQARATISNVLSGYEDYDYRSASYQHYLYAEYAGNIRKLLYRIGAGATHVTNDNSDTREHRWFFTPKLVLAFNPSKNVSLQWENASWTTAPGISQLSNNAQLVIPGVMRQGNPYLRAFSSYNSKLVAKWNTRWINAQLTLGYTYRDSPVSRYWTEQTVGQQTYIVGMQENAHYSSDAGFRGTLTLRPFGNEVLSLQIQSGVMWQTVSSPIIGHYHHTCAPLYYRLDFRKGPWGASYNGLIQSKQLNGSTLDAGESQSHFTAYWQKGGWQLRATCMWMFSRSKYSSASLPTTILQENSRTWINDNASMVVLGLSYHFSTGHNLKYQKKLQNADRDNGSF